MAKTSDPINHMPAPGDAFAIRVELIAAVRNWHKDDDDEAGILQ